MYTVSAPAHRDGIRDTRVSDRPGRALPLEKVAEAHQAQDSGSMAGKILIEVG